MLFFLQKLVTNISSREERYFCLKNVISCSPIADLCMVMKEKQQECVDFFFFLKIFCLPSLTLPAEICQHRWGFQSLWGSSLSSCHTWLEIFAFWRQPGSTFGFLSIYFQGFLLFVPLLSPFCVLLSLLHSPCSHLFGCPSSFATFSYPPPYFVPAIPFCKIPEKAFESKQHWSHFLVAHPPFTACDMISYISAHNQRINI